MNEAKTLGVGEKKNPKAIQGPVELFFIHLTFPLTTSSLSWVGVYAHAQPKWVCQCKFSSWFLPSDSLLTQQSGSFSPLHGKGL